MDRYNSGECGGNLIYKYRSKSIAEYFEPLHRSAYRYLKEYLLAKGVEGFEDIFHELERFSRYQKFSLFDVEYGVEETFSYDIPKLISDPSYARTGGTLEGLHYPTTIRIQHTPQQQETIRRELAFYGDDIPGLTMLISRYPVKRFWRRAQVLNREPVTA